MCVVGGGEGAGGAKGTESLHPGPTQFTVSLEANTGTPQTLDQQPSRIFPRSPLLPRTSTHVQRWQPPPARLGRRAVRVRSISSHIVVARRPSVRQQDTFHQRGGAVRAVSLRCRPSPCLSLLYLPPPRLSRVQSATEAAERRPASGEREYAPRGGHAVHVAAVATVKVCCTLRRSQRCSTGPWRRGGGLYTCRHHRTPNL